MKYEELESLRPAIEDTLRPVWGALEVKFAWLSGETDRDWFDQVFSRLYEHCAKLDPPTVGAYAATILRHMVHNVGRWQQTKASHLPGAAFHEQAKQERANAAQALFEDQEWVRLALQKLDPDQREVLTWRFFDGLAFREIADQLGLSVPAAFQRVAKALKALEAQLLSKAER